MHERAGELGKGGWVVGIGAWGAEPSAHIASSRHAQEPSYGGGDKEKRCRQVKQERPVCRKETRTVSEKFPVTVHKVRIAFDLFAHLLCPLPPVSRSVSFFSPPPYSLTHSLTQSLTYSGEVPPGARAPHGHGDNQGGKGRMHVQDRQEEGVYSGHRQQQGLRRRLQVVQGRGQLQQKGRAQALVQNREIHTGKCRPCLPSCRNIELVLTRWPAGPLSTLNRSTTSRSGRARPRRAKRPYLSS